MENSNQKLPMIRGFLMIFTLDHLCKFKVTGKKKCIICDQRYLFNEKHCLFLLNIKIANEFRLCHDFDLRLLAKFKVIDKQEVNRP